MKKIIAIDGPSGSGKSTISRLLSKELNLLYLDTGAMYRAVALQAKRMEIDFNDGEKLNELCRNLDLHFKSDGESTKLYIGKEDISLAIRSPDIDLLSSRISAIREVREALTRLQRNIGKKRRMVAEGRDMGTVVFPDAEYKFFVTASPKIRAERRYKERISRGESISKAEVERALRRRDLQDETRSIAPLRPAKDAQFIDTTTLNPDQVVEKILMSLKKEKD